MAARDDIKANPNDPYVSRKTVDTSSAAQTPPKIVQSGKSNVLNKYRSYNYNFTLSALRKDVVNDPTAYRNAALDFIILKSGGKGIQGFSTDVSGVDRVVGEKETEIREGGRVLSKTKESIIKKDFSGSNLVEGFNKNSPGRFDMFIDDIEIETLMTFSKEGGSTLPTSIKFKVTEPYSINGFIEALHVSAVGAGYTSYTEASFLLKMEFIGYPDDDNFSFKDSKVVEDSTRYFPIKFSGVEVEVGEKGTVYRCAAIPWNEIAFGQANTLKRPITMAGISVQEILKNFAKNLNEQIKEDDKKSRSNAATKDNDEYEIVFPVRDNNGFDYNKTNDIGKSSLKSILRNSAIFKFNDPGKAPQTQTAQQKDAAPEEVKLHPTSGTPPQVQFAEGQQINEIISAVIRDSEYVKDILKEKKIDDNGFVSYFAIKSDVINKSEIDPVARKPYQKFRFSVIPYKVHFTKIPTFANQKYNPENITRLSLREYNYIYTGNNVDVLNFKLNFNSLFFEAVPAAMGNNDQPGSRDGAGQPNDTSQKLKPEDLENSKKDQNPSGTVKATPVSVIRDGANASQPDTDPYYTLARNMHSAIIDSKASMISGEIEILGDPFYLVTGGIGNYDPKPSSTQGMTIDGEADHLQGEVLVTINFRNPIDINPLEKGGMFYFETEKLPFSGVYRILKVQNTFRDGVFKQRLEIIRYPGQIIGKVKETLVTDRAEDVPKPGAQQVQTTTAGTNQGGLPISEANALELLKRGLPSPGLPGLLSNFTNAIGGLGGNISSLLNQVSGAVSKGITGLAGANSVFGVNALGGLDQLASGIRMQASGLINTLQSNLGNAASLVQAGAIVSSSFSVNNATNSLAASITDKANAVANLVSVKGSGIGEGASILIDKVSAAGVQQIQSGVAAASDLFKSTTVLPTNIAVFTGQVKELSSTALTSVTALGAGSAAGLISGVNSKITNLTSSIPSDPAAIAAKFGINPNQLSGLSGGLQSKILGQLDSISKKVPDDANLSIATARGLSLNSIPTEKLANIPATAPYSIAPKPEVDTKFLTDLVKTGGPMALANAFGVSDVKKISADLLPTQSVNSLLSQVKSGINNPLASLTGNLNLPDASALAGKLSSANNLLNSVSKSALGSVELNLSSLSDKVGGLTAGVNGLSNSVIGKFGSVSVGQSPLDKLLGKG